MPRPQSFDEAEVVSSAMRLFWSQGYVDTGMSQILAATGLKPGSFYNAFASKRALFLNCLSHYIDSIVAKRIEDHLDKEDPVNAIEEFFLTSFEIPRKEEITGCLLTNTATEIGAGDAEINTLVWSGMHKIQLTFEACIIEGQARNLVDPGLDPEAAALHLLSCFQGMCVIGRLTQDKARLRRLTKTALAILKPPTTNYAH